MARGPSPRDEAARRSSKSQRGWEDEEEDAPWLDEGDYEDDGPTHTLVGRSTLMWIIGILAVLALGVTVGLLLVSKREETPIDVPAVGEDVPVLKNPGAWKVPPVGQDVEGIPVDGQGQVMYGTGEGRDADSRIDVDTLPEDPLDKPGAATPSEEEMADRPAPLPPKVILPEAQRQQAANAAAAPPTAPPRAMEQVVPQPKVVAAAPKPTQTPQTPAAGDGSAVQLGAFSSQARALGAYKTMAARFGYLAGLEPSVVPTTRDGQTLYRLRVPAGSAAAARDICNRLKLAGEPCSVVH